MNDDETSNALRRVQSELLTEDTLLRPVQGAMNYKFRTELEASNDARGNP